MNWVSTVLTEVYARYCFQQYCILLKTLPLQHAPGIDNKAII